MIVFKRLTFQNILSVGNQSVSIDLDNSKTTLIHGTNGSGKSTILDALTYALFGKSFRGVNLTQLVNSQNKKALLVECEFNIGKDTFIVRRGMKPKVFEIFKNAEIIESKAADKDNQNYLEQNILKLSFKSFTQIVILGSSNFVPFMQLNSTGRRDCVEDFLDIKVFSVMALMARERLRTLREQNTIKEAEYSALCFKIETLEDKIREMSQRDDAEIGKYEKQIRDNEVKALECEVCLNTWYKDVVNLTEEIDDAQKLGSEKQVKKLNTVLIKLNTKLERLAKEKEFYDTNGSCHTCKQPIGYEHAEIQKGELQKEVEEIDKASIQAAEMMSKQQSVVDHITELNLRMSKFNQEVFKLQTQLQAHRNEIDSCKNYIVGVKEMSNDTEKEQAVLLSLQEEVKRMKAQRLELKQTISNHEVVVSLLKDSGVKSQIVKKYLPAMNKFIRYYLNELDFPIHFQLDSEFNETVRSPLHQDFSYSSFSEGQKGRIDLALMFTWREIGRLKNSVTTNLLILDEVFSSSLDDTGKECLLQLLRYRLPDDQRIVVVDHTLSSAFKDKFDSSLEVTRKGGFSRYT